MDEEHRHRNAKGLDHEGVFPPSEDRFEEDSDDDAEDDNERFPRAEVYHDKDACTQS